MSKTCQAAMVTMVMVAIVGTAAASYATQADAGALVGQLTKELGVTEAQARGGAGTLFSLAKGKMEPSGFDQVSKAVPGMDGLLKAAPALDAMGGGGLGQLSTLASAAGAFKKLGLDPSMASKFVPVLTKFVGGSGGAGTAALLANALK